MHSFDRKRCVYTHFLIEKNVSMKKEGQKYFYTPCRALASAFPPVQLQNRFILGAGRGGAHVGPGRLTGGPCGTGFGFVFLFFFPITTGNAEACSSCELVIEARDDGIGMGCSSHLPMW